MNNIEWSKKAVRQLRKIHTMEAKRIHNAVSELANLETCNNVKKLANFQYDYRLRVGNYRVFFNHDKTVQIVWIEEVKKRDERTY